MIYSCGKEPDEVQAEIIILDTYFQSDTANQQNILQQFDRIADLLPGSQQKDNGNFDSTWLNIISYRWSNDGLITCLRSVKRFDQNVSNEIILNVRDTVLFIKRFDVWFDANRKSGPGFVFLEEFKVLHESGVGRIWRRVRFNASSAADTIEFRKQPYLPQSDSIQRSFHDEMFYSRHILVLN